ncbi:MAG TPA: hypothetical protein VLV45_03075 [Gemmatimonadales bacterium]|nr:hypothetical protein [Gemmatimonadales bacterium]
MNSPTARAIALALMLATSGCALTFDAHNLGVAATMAEPAQAQPAGAQFHITKHPVYFLWGLMAVSEPNLEDVLEGQVGNGNSIASLRIHVRARLSDLVITGLTLGLISPRSVTYEGIVVSR